MAKSSTTWKKGQVTNPKGRPPVLIPELQKVIDGNRNAMKALIIQKLDDKVHDWVDSIIASGSEQGDVLKFKMLLEMALGKMVDDPPDFPVSDEEKLLILEFRRRKKESLERVVTGESPDTK